jgi:hypothetical protein
MPQSFGRGLFKSVTIRRQRSLDLSQILSIILHYLKLPQITNEPVGSIHYAEYQHNILYQTPWVTHEHWAKEVKGKQIMLYYPLVDTTGMRSFSFGDGGWITHWVKVWEEISGCWLCYMSWPVVVSLSLSLFLSVSYTHTYIIFQE